MCAFVCLTSLLLDCEFRINVIVHIDKAHWPRGKIIKYLMSLNSLLPIYRAYSAEYLHLALC